MNKLKPNRAKVLDIKKAEAIVSTSDVNMELVEQLHEKYYDEIKALSSWIQSPNYRTIQFLQPLNKFITENYLIDSSVEIFRGIKPGSNQNIMNLPLSGPLKNVIQLKVGEKISLAMKDPCSFTSCLDIAKHYGDFVIKIQANKLSQVFPITDEMCFVVNKLRNTINNNTMICQLEYIVLPFVHDVEFEVVYNATLEKTIGPPAKDW